MVPSCRVTHTYFTATAATSGLHWALLAAARGSSTALAALALSNVPARDVFEFVSTWALLFTLPFGVAGVVELPAARLARELKQRWAVVAFYTAAGAGWFALLAFCLPFYGVLGLTGGLAVSLGSAGTAAVLSRGPSNDRTATAFSLARGGRAALGPVAAVASVLYADPVGRYDERYVDTRRGVDALAALPGGQSGAEPRDELDNLALAGAVAHTFMDAHPPDRLPWSWEEAVVTFGLLTYANRAEDTTVRPFVRRWADSHYAEALHGPLWADVAAPAINLVVLYCGDRSPPDDHRRIVHRVARYVTERAPQTTRGAISHVGRLLGGYLPRQAWVDSQFMHGVFLTRFAACAADRGAAEVAEMFIAAAERQAFAFSAHLQDDNTGLYRHATVEVGPVRLTLPVEPYYWARGNAWATYFLVDLRTVQRALDRPPHDALDRLLPSILAAQDPDTGLFFGNLLGGKEPSNPTETSASALITAALIRGLRADVFATERAEQIRGVVRRALRGLRERIVWRNGRPFVIGTTTGTSPGYTHYYNHVPRRESVGHGVGAVLMALAEADEDF